MTFSAVLLASAAQTGSAGLRNALIIAVLLASAAQTGFAGLRNALIIAVLLASAAIHVRMADPGLTLKDNGKKRAEKTGEAKG